MVDLERFVVEGRFGPITLGASTADIEAAFGEPDHVEPQRRSSPKMMLYGRVEFRLYDDHLSTLSIGLPEDGPLNSGTIRTTGLWPADRRSMPTISALLATGDVGWRLDPVMSAIHDAEDSQSWITNNHVHLGFFEGRLDRIALTDLDG